MGACAALVLGQWLSLRLQSLSAVLVVAVALLGTLQNHRLLPPFLSMLTRWDTTCVKGGGAACVCLCLGLCIWLCLCLCPCL